MVNILLMNLLIAMFSNSYQQVQENSESWYNLQRLIRITEYFDKSIFPLPLTYLLYWITELLNLLACCKLRDKLTPDFLIYRKRLLNNEKEWKNLQEEIVAKISF